MTTQHTPTPWQYFPNETSEGGTIAALAFPGDKFPVLIAFLPTNANKAGTNPGTIDANAAFIVRACNAHDELVAALTKIAEWDHPSHQIFETAPVSVDALAAIARAALAKVSK